MTLTLLPTKARETRSGMAFDSFPAMEFLITIAGGAASNLIGNYLWKKLTSRKDKNRRVHVKINRRITEYDDEGQISRVIEEEIKGPSDPRPYRI